jgi:hypothetical protein
MDGWIKYHRSFIDHWLYKTKLPKTRREAWEDMLLIVNFDPKKVLIRGILYDCLRGQSLLSLDSWAKEFNWSIQQVRTFFSLLENDKMITTEGLQYSTRLTICNYDYYQGSSTDEQQTKEENNNKPITSQQQAANKPLTTTKERIKKVKKEKKYSEFIIPTIEEVKKYFKENGYKEETAIKMFNSYAVADWIDSKGNQVKNWKQKAINVWFKDENKIVVNNTERTTAIYNPFDGN